MSKTVCLRHIRRPRASLVHLLSTHAARWLCIAGLLTWTAALACAQPPAPAPTSAPATKPAGPTRAFQQPTTAATREAVHGIWIVGGIATVGVLAIFVGAWYFYAPKAWQRPDQPTPPVPPSALDQADLADAYERKDRFDLEGDLGDFIAKTKRPPG